MEEALLETDWYSLLKEEFTESYYLRLKQFLEQEYKEKVVYPEKSDLFTAFQRTSYADVKVVIVGQDPYHGEGQAHGMCFSVKPGVKPPPSLKNIYKELADDVGIEPPSHGCLSAWADQGVLLLNAVLTVRAHTPTSHKGQGWEQFIDKVLQLLNEKEQPVVFIGWGRPAQRKLEQITAPHHQLLHSPHPSPLAAHRGFFGSKPFSRVNEFLQLAGIPPVNWELPPLSNEADDHQLTMEFE